MTHELIDRIGKLTDREVIRALEFFAGRVFEGVETSPQEIVEGVPVELRNEPIFSRVLKLSDQERADPLPEGESARLAREILFGLAKNPAFGPPLKEALDQYKDDKLLAAEILSLGVAISMIVVASSTAVQGKIGSFRIKKTTVDGNFIEKLLKGFPKLNG